MSVAWDPERGGLDGQLRAVEPRIVHRGGRSAPGRVVAGALRVIGRPVGDLWPMHPVALRALDQVMAPVGWTGRRAAVEHVEAGSVPAELVRVPAVSERGCTLLLLHGGGFMFGSPRMYRGLAAVLSAACKAQVLVPDYRHPPHAAVATMLEDCAAAYRWLVAHEPPERVLVVGDSAGGNLAFATLRAARAEGLPMPAALVGMSAWLDLDYEHARGAPRDAFFALRFARRAAALCRQGDAIHPGLCPLDTPLDGFPPVLLQVGSTEPLRPANEEIAHHLAAAGVACELQLWADQPHVFQVFAGVIPEATEALREIGRFARTVL